MKWLVELFFGEFKEVVCKVIPTKDYWLVVVGRHSITGTVRGYIDMGKRPFYKLSEKVAMEYIEEYENKNK